MTTKDDELYQSIYEQCIKKNLSNKKCHELTGISREVISKILRDKSYIFNKKTNKWLVDDSTQTLEQVPKNEYFEKLSKNSVYLIEKEIEFVKTKLESIKKTNRLMEKLSDCNTERIESLDKKIHDLSLDQEKLMEKQKKGDDQQKLIEERLEWVEDQQKRFSKQNLIIDKKKDESRYERNEPKQEDNDDIDDENDESYTENFLNIKKRYKKLIEENADRQNSSVITSIRMSRKINDQINNYTQKKNLKKIQLITVLLVDFMKNNP